MACILSFGRAAGSYMISKSGTSDLIHLAAQHTLDKHKDIDSSTKDEVILLADWLTDLNEESGIAERHVALDHSRYKSLLDYWNKNDFKFDYHRYAQNQQSQTVQQWIYHACFQALVRYSQTYKCSVEDIAHRISHVVCHTSVPATIPSMAHNIIIDLNLKNNCYPVQLSSLGGIAGNTSLDTARNIVHNNKNSCVLGVCFETATSHMDWFDKTVSKRQRQATWGGAESSEEEQDTSLSSERMRYAGNVLFGDGAIAYIVGDPASEALKIDMNDLDRDHSFWELGASDSFGSAKTVSQDGSHVRQMILPRTREVGAGDPGIGSTGYLSGNMALAKNLLFDMSDFSLGQIMQSAMYRNNKNVPTGRSVHLEQCEFALHPGSKNIIKGYEWYLQYVGAWPKESENFAGSVGDSVVGSETAVDADPLAHIWDSFRDNGNTIGCASLYVLNDIIDTTHKDYIHHISYGPGLSVAFGALTRRKKE